MKYRKRPIIVDAVQWPDTIAVDYETASARREIILDSLEVSDEWRERVTIVDTEHGRDITPASSDVFPLFISLCVHTLEGFVYVDPREWLIKGVAGELYPCNDEIFKKLYDRVED